MTAASFLSALIICVFCQFVKNHLSRTENCLRSPFVPLAWLLLYIEGSTINHLCIPEAGARGKGMKKGENAMFQITNDPKAFAKLFDQSLLLDTSRHQEYLTLCEESIKYGFACVAVNGFAIRECAQLLSGHDINLTCATSFPLGICSLDTKLAEAYNAFKDGATDIDFVLNISKILDHEFDYIEKESRAIVDLCRQEKKIVKLIFETCYLNADEITTLCKIANTCGPDFIKTNTGTHGPATVEAVETMRREALPQIKVKASGGVHNLEIVEKMVAAGAERIGTITASRIMEEYIQKYCG